MKMKATRVTAIPKIITFMLFKPRSKQVYIFKRRSKKTSAPIGAWKCNLPPFLKIDRRTDGFMWKLNLQ